MVRRTLAGAAVAVTLLSVGLVSTGHAANVASTPVSDGGVTPYIIDGENPGGNRTCAEAGFAFGATFDLTTDRENYPADFGVGAFEWSDDLGPIGEFVDVTVTDDKFVAFDSPNIVVGAAIVKGSNAANVYYYDPGVHADSGLASPPNASTNFSDLSNLTFCGSPGPIDEEDEGTLTVEKFYDANANGVFDGGDVLIDGWRFDVDGTVELTPYSEVVPAGPYTVTEHTPVETNWVHTTATSFDVEVLVGEETIVQFGNLCLGGGNGRTLGFWSNRNGQALIAADDLAALVALNLRKADGTHFDPANSSALRTWLLNATATNMAYMLSAQLAAMQLNVHNGLVSGAALIYAPGTTSANALGFATVSAVIAEANASLGADGLTPAGHPARSYQEALKNALDNANNNLTFVQGAPCPFSFPALP